MGNGNRKRNEKNKLNGDALSNDQVPKPKMTITAKLKVTDGNAIEKVEVVDKSDKQLIEEKKTYARKKNVRKNIGWLISRLNEPTDVEYDGQLIRVSPRCRGMKIADYELLGKLPSGVVLKKKK